MPPVGFEPIVPAGERPQTYALDRAATGTGTLLFYVCKIEHQLVAQCVNLLINAPTCFGLNCGPSSGSPQFFLAFAAYVSTCAVGIVYMIELTVTDIKCYGF
jgi:hypothetical protein